MTEIFFKRFYKMAQATVKTTQFVDPRIEPQPDPVYNHVIGPVQNQYYKMPASGLSDSSLTFNNLTTLGVDRAYLDTFELEIKAEIRFITNKSAAAQNLDVLCPTPDQWTFDSFPFNKCCEEARVNINGGAFFSQPLSYVRAKERYMNQRSLSRCYENICPVHKPMLQTESGKLYDDALSATTGKFYNTPVQAAYTTVSDTPVVTDVKRGMAIPTRLGVGMYGAMQSAEGWDGSYNNSIVRLGKPYEKEGKVYGYDNYYIDPEHKEQTVVTVTWREPLFVSPFSSRYDATYGRPLYNITSLDFTFNMQNLGNMIRLANLSTDPSAQNAAYVTEYAVHIKSANLVYQVMTIPASLNKPLTTLVPYRRFVPFITDYTGNDPKGAETSNMKFKGGHVQITSGVYTMNEIPTAVWVFLGPTKDIYQTNEQDVTTDGGVNAVGNWDSNKLFGYLTHISITMANTTQILDTAQVPDLYRIAKANGCEDSYWSWAVNDAVNVFAPVNAADATHSQIATPMYYGAGSVLRLIPGVDLIVPDQPLIPGANANNMVIQMTADFDLPPHSKAMNKCALWLLFEYVGVAAISPGQCEITMNPLGSGEIMAVSPVLSATSAATEGTLDGSGAWDNIKSGLRIAHQIATDTGIISKILKAIPNAKVQEVGNFLASKGFGQPGMKRSRGGAVIGLGDWT